MNIKRPSESWEILSDGLWFDWEEHFKKTACVHTAHTRFGVGDSLLIRGRLKISDGLYNLRIY